MQSRLKKCYSLIFGSKEILKNKRFLSREKAPSKQQKEWKSGNGEGEKLKANG